MLDKIKAALLIPRNQKIALAAVFGILIFAIIATSAALIMSGGTNSNSSSGSSSSGNSTAGSGSNLKGNTSSLAGSTASTRNLKGLTLRINQIETCNPKVISAYVAVSSEVGVVNKNFSKKDVKVYVDNKQISDFEFNSVDAAKSPLTNMLVIDHSGSMAGAPMENAKSAASQYVQKLKTGDRVGVIQFDDRVETLVSVTTDKQAAVNAIGGIQPRGDTAIFDALASGISAVPDCGRKAVTVLSDGDDTASKNNSTQSVIDAANKTNLPVFSVGIKGEGFNPAFIKQISEGTGGQYLEANTPAEINNLYNNIDGQLTGQFVTNLRLNISKDGTLHTLKIVSNVEGSPTTSTRTFIY